MYLYLFVKTENISKWIGNYLPFGWLIELEGALREVVADADCCVEMN